MNKRIIKFLLTLLLFPLELKAESADALIPFLSQQPVLDGRIADDIAWKDIAPLGPFYLLKNGEKAVPQTAVRVGVWGDSLYFGVVAIEPEVAKIKAKLNDTEDLWTEDSIEVFILPKGSKDYCQFVVNAAGKRFNGRNAGDVFPLWDWEAKTYKDRDCWSVEIRIPFLLFNAIPSGVWRGNICRNRRISQESYSSWASQQVSFHQSGKWGRLIFLPCDASRPVSSDLVGIVKKELDSLPGRETEGVSKRMREKGKAAAREYFSCLDYLTLGDAYALLGEIWGFRQREKSELEQLRRRTAEIKFLAFKRRFFKERWVK
ncbi:MAG: hypothetical protein PHP98_07955 [Kiritimatiellae bacterium]|nr:hypothetical protein [Kiritimatiellia bacterium]